MKNFFSLSMVTALALVTAACSAHPDRCIEDLDCGVVPYTKERTANVMVGDETLKVSRDANMTSMPMAEPQMIEPMEPIAPIEPMMENEPVKGTAEQIFDSRLTK